MSSVASFKLMHVANTSKSILYCIIYGSERSRMTELKIVCATTKDKDIIIFITEFFAVQRQRRIIIVALQTKLNNILIIYSV